MTGRELEVLKERRQHALERNQDTMQLESLIEDIQENINYVQETISETQHNVMEIEETQDVTESNGIQDLVESVFNVDEAKYLMQKLFGMILSQNQSVVQRDAKLREYDATLAEVCVN